MAERGQTVASLARALRRNAHTLTQRPDLTWQQLHTEWVAGLVGVDDLFEAERRRRIGPGAAPWLAARAAPAPLPGLVRSLGVDDLPMLACAASRDNTIAIAGGERGVLSVWRIDSGRRLRTIGPHPAPITACALSEDTKFAATGCEDGSVRVWQLFSGRLSVTFTGHTARVIDCTFSPDGSILYSTAEDGAAARWDLVDQKPIEFQEPLEELGNVRGHALSGDAWTVASVFGDGLVIVGSLRTAGGRSMEILPRVNALAFSPDGRTVACAGDGVALWDVSADRAVVLEWKEREPLPECTAITFTPGGERIVVGDVRGGITVIEVATTTELGWWQADARRVESIAVTADGAAVLVCGRDGGVRLWRLARPRGVFGPGGVAGCAFSPDGERVYSASLYGTVADWDVASGTLARKFEQDDEPRLYSTCDANASIVVAGALRGGILRVWDAATGARRRDLVPAPEAVFECAVADDGTVASAGRDGDVLVWRDEGARFAHRLEGDAGPVLSIALTPDGRYVFTGAVDGKLRRWNLAELTWELGVHDAGVRSIALDVERERLATGGADGVARLWAMTGFGLLQTFAGHSDQVMACALSASGDLLATASADDWVRIWSIASGRVLAAAPLGADAMCVAFHPQLPLIACGDLAGGLYLFDLVGVEELCAPL